jgi:hypothetical protein
MLLLRFAFKDAAICVRDTRTGKSEDGKGVIKAIISGPDVSVTISKTRWTNHPLQRRVHAFNGNSFMGVFVQK